MRLFIIIVFGASCASPPDLAANADELAVEMNTAVELAVLENDVGVDAAPKLEIVTAPAAGEATLDERGVLHYVPVADYLGDDTLEYRVTNADGATAIAGVAIKVGCATCAIGGTITLAWDASPISDNVTGYRVYSGATMDPSTFTLIDDVLMTRPGFDPAAPSVTYDSWQTLHLRIGELVCFALTAYNTAGESGFSNVACKTVTPGAMNFGL